MDADIYSLQLELKVLASTANNYRMGIEIFVSEKAIVPDTDLPFSKRLRQLKRRWMKFVKA